MIPIYERRDRERFEAHHNEARGRMNNVRRYAEHNKTLDYSRRRPRDYTRSRSHEVLTYREKSHERDYCEAGDILDMKQNGRRCYSSERRNGARTVVLYNSERKHPSRRVAIEKADEERAFPSHYKMNVPERPKETHNAYHSPSNGISSHKRRSRSPQYYKFHPESRPCRKSEETAKRARSPDKPDTKRFLSQERMHRDKEDHLIYKPGHIINRRFEIQRTLGKGTFGQVVLVKDMDKDVKRDRQYIALKIIRDVPKYRHAAEMEIKFLKRINDAEKDAGMNLCVRLLDYFNYHGHMCLMFEKLGISVFDFLKRNEYHMYDMDQTRHMAYQLCTAIAFLHSIDVAHTDLKPENILFKYTEYKKVSPWARGFTGQGPIRKMIHSYVKIIDFGSATSDADLRTSTVTTRHYRAPEVLLGVGWDKKCDIFSIGAIIFEIATGVTLFQTHEDREHLAMMEHILGNFKTPLIERTPSKYDYFLYNKRLSSYELNLKRNKKKIMKYVVENCKPLEEYFYDKYNDVSQCGDLIHLLKLMLIADPEERPSLKDLLHHAYFDDVPKDLRIQAAKQLASRSQSHQRTSQASYRKRSYTCDTRSPTYKSSRHDEHNCRDDVYRRSHTKEHKRQRAEYY